MPATTETSPGFAFVEAASGKEIELSMQRLWLTGRVLAAGARLLVQHVFQTAEKRPVEVVYAFALPRDAALRRFIIRGDGFTAHSELKLTSEAVKLYEAGIERGALAALVRQYRDGVMNLSVGNIRPGETVTVTLEIIAGVESRDDGFRFRFPFTLAPGYHPRARMLETEPGTGEIELPEDEFGDVVLPKFKQNPHGLHAVGFDLRLFGALKEVGSPSHGIRVQPEDDGARVVLAREKDLPDRDLVLDARRKTLAPEVFQSKGEFIAIVPSTSFGTNPKSARRVVIVLDRSGSMQGDPIAQARKAIEACLGALSVEDQFGLIAFDDHSEPFRPALSAATKENRELARGFLRNIHARGGTELAAAIEAAAKMSAGPADVLILTDGQLYGTEQILARARAACMRLHTLGIGSASQDRFLALLARETGGVSRFVTAQERVDLTAVDLFASIGAPVAYGIEAGGVVIQPAPASNVFAGTPLVVYGEAQAGAALHLTWTGGALEIPIDGAGRCSGETLRLLRGARLITDFESRYSTEDEDVAGNREAGRIRERIRALSVTYGMASREMSLVSVVTRKGDKTGEVPKTQIVAVGMPQDTSFHTYFPQQVGSPRPAEMFGAPDVLGFVGFGGGRLERARFSAVSPLLPPTPPPAQAHTPAPSDPLLDLASSIEDDGGMPGTNMEDRILRSVVAVLSFLQQGHSTTTGAFRSHVQRIINFLQTQAGTRETVNLIIEKAKRGEPLAGGSLNANASWKEIEAALHGTFTI